MRVNISFITVDLDFNAKGQLVADIVRQDESHTNYVLGQNRVIRGGIDGWIMISGELTPQINWISKAIWIMGYDERCDFVACISDTPNIRMKQLYLKKIIESFDGLEFENENNNS